MNGDKNEVKKENRRDGNRRNRKGLIVGLSIVSGALALSSAALGVSYAVNMSSSMQYQTELQNVYQKNLYDLVEGVNNAEVKLSKALSSNDKDFQKKMLAEVVKNSQLAESSISSLPITQNSLADSVKFINQLGGYSTTVMESLASETQLSEEEKTNLTKLHTSLVKLKDRLNEYANKIQKGTSILSEDIKLDGEKNTLTVKLSAKKEVSVDYPTMIYDGPFSDSETDYVVRGLKGSEVSKSDTYNSVVKHFKNISNVNYAGEINSNFETYNYELKTTSGHNLFVQVSKIGGHILTVSGYHDGTIDNKISEGEAERIALDFVKSNGIANPAKVWQDKLGDEIYFNIAPVQNGIILYPDLVKVKVDLSTGTVIGYDATGYFINHVERNLVGDFIDVVKAKESIPKGYEATNGRLCLAPLEYGREVVCYEFTSEHEGETYYFYINAVNGKLENVLKVLESSDGAKLM